MFLKLEPYKLCENTNNISFVIPAYNCEQFIEQAVHSIFETNFSKGDEVVICDDGSFDDTEEILNRLVKIYTDIKLLKHKTNRGGGAARNTAVDFASNELIFCLDSDNMLPKGVIAPLKQFMLDNNADMAAFANVHFFREDIDKVEKVLSYTQGPYPLQDYLSQIDVPGGDGNYLYTKAAWKKVGGYPEFAHAMDTWGFGLRMAAEEFKSILFSEKYYFHRVGHGSYWDRCKGLPISKIALQLLIPYLDKIVDTDIKYIFNNSSSWYRNIEKRPVRTKYALEHGLYSPPTRVFDRFRVPFLSFLFRRAK